MSVKIDTEVWSKIFNDVKALEKAHVKVGIYGGGDNVGDGLTLAGLAAVHEFGTEDGRIPERRWLRGGLEFEQAKTKRTMVQITKAVVENKITPEQALNIVGKALSTGIQRYIRSNKIQPPSQKIGAFKIENPDDKVTPVTLIDTGRFVNSITSEVDMGTGGTK